MADKDGARVGRGIGCWFYPKRLPGPKAIQIGSVIPMWFRTLLAFTVIVMLGALDARAGIQPLEQSVTVDTADGEATFRLDFGHVPNFDSTGPHGHPMDSFQYEVAPVDAPPGAFTNDITAVIRGDEIGYAAGDLRLRAAAPADPYDPTSGGWGPITATVPLRITGSDVMFTAPLSALGASNGQFAYRVFTMEDGAIQAEAQSLAIPLPPALWAGLAVLLSLGAAAAGRSSAYAAASVRRA